MTADAAVQTITIDGAHYQLRPPTDDLHADREQIITGVWTGDGRDELAEGPDVPTRRLHIIGAEVYDLEYIEDNADDVVDAFMGNDCELVMVRDGAEIRVNDPTQAARLGWEGWQTVGVVCPECQTVLGHGNWTSLLYPLLECPECGSQVDVVYVDGFTRPMPS